MLRRMIQLDMDSLILFDVYTKEVRSILEFAVPVWHSGLTKLQVMDIENIQKVTFKIILGTHYTTYRNACELLSTQTLQETRVNICHEFAKKNMKSENSIFTKLTKKVNTRQKSILVKVYKCRTGRYTKSPLPYLWPQPFIYSIL